MNLLDRFSSHLRDCLARGIHLAAELKNPEVEPIHLFFTIASEKGSVASEIMNRFKITPKTLEQALLALPNKKESAIQASTTTQYVLTPLSPFTKTALEKAMMIAEENNHNYIGTEHLLAALVRLNDPVIQDVLAANLIDRTELDKQLETVLANATHFPKLTEMSEVIEQIEGELPHDHDHTVIPEDEPIALPKKGKKKESALEFFAVQLTNPATQKNIDPVIGREKEIERVIQIICRRTKNNPLLLGEPGVGKTAIVEGLAKRIVKGHVPDLLLNKKIYSLDMGMLIAGTIYRGEFEARLRQVIDEATNDPSIILFIDEIHNIVGAGSNQGTMDAANILKPALSRGQLRCIGATTPQEYKKYIENDAALERRFQPIYAKEPSIEDTTRILEGIKENYEAYHKIIIAPSAIAAAVKLSHRYITNKFLPDKAIDLIDETAAAKRLTIKTANPESKLFRLEQKLEKIILAKEVAAQNDKFTEAVTLKKEEEDLRKKIKDTALGLKEKKVTMLGTITDNDVAVQVARIIGTPPTELLLNETDGLTNLEERLRDSIVGQDVAIREVTQLIRQAKLGLSNPDRPLASCLFVGESGVGKTELAKTLAKVLYPNSESFIKLDMSEFNEAFGVSKLLGSPAGYIGYKESNQFTDKLKLNPHAVVLFDEIDKAHKDVTKLLLQMLENGEITDSSGKKISLRHAIVILTTSFGAAEIKRGRFGFGDEDRKHDIKQILLDKLKDYFTPEVINRLDQICLFEPLDSEKLVRIAELELKRFNERLKSYATSVSSNNDVLTWIVGQLPGNQAGARDIRRFLRGQVEMLMSEIILRRKLKKRFNLAVQNNTLTIK